jgi:hypothetical protein
MHVSVDQAGHHHSTAQIDDLGALADQRFDTRIVADIDDHAVTHGQCMLHAIVGIDRVHIAVLIDDIGRRWVRGRYGAGAERQQHRDSPCPRTPPFPTRAKCRLPLLTASHVCLPRIKSQSIFNIDTSLSPLSYAMSPPSSARTGWLNVRPIASAGSPGNPA